MERIEAFFSGPGFNPHRHDTYAIGTTLSGVQSFQHSHFQRHSLPGNILVLHPDEVHDGQAGTEAGFRYRMVYIEPALIQQVLGGKPLSFIEGGGYLMPLGCIELIGRCCASWTPLWSRSKKTT